jgi:hypothetical protein
MGRYEKKGTMIIVGTTELYELQNIFSFIFLETCHSLWISFGGCSSGWGECDVFQLFSELNFNIFGISYSQGWADDGTLKTWLLYCNN